MQNDQPSDVAARFVRLPSIAERKLGHDYVAPVRLDPRILDQMQRMIRELGTQYAETLKAQVGSLFAFIDPACGGSADARGQLYNTAHEVRGIAGTFGFPVVGRFANSLCGYLETRTSLDPTVIRFHVEAMYDALQNVNADPALAAETLRSLETLIEKSKTPERSAG
jgi:hypothetical protein